MPTYPTSRLRIIGEVNKSLLPVVEKDKNFTEAPPHLFGPEFAQKTKEFVEQTRAMRTTLNKRERRPLFFRGGPPKWGGGGIRATERERRRPSILLAGQTLPEKVQPAQQQTELNIIHCSVCPSKFCPKIDCKNILTNQIACLGIAPAEFMHLPAGRLKVHINTWKVLTRDP